MIEELVNQEDARKHDADWHTWLPELEAKFKDRTLSLIADRFKFESIAQHASERGMQNIQDVLKLLGEVEPKARERYPRHAFIDAIYKYLADRRGRPV